MKASSRADRPVRTRKIVSRADALFLMIASAAAAIGTTFHTVTAVVGLGSGPTTLTVPLAAARQDPVGLVPGAEGRYTEMELTISAVPVDEAVFLAWSAALNQVGILAVALLVFLLGFRFMRERLFTPGSDVVVGMCGIVLAVASTVGQLLGAVGKTRLAEAVGAYQPTHGETIVFVGEINLLPSLAGLMLLVIAGVFQFGRRLQKDTEGLV
ncbi:hypothetical protein F8G81_14995 [Arthrobacter sp. CDRTa11]|uniref:hypothetical protein n=1 Tax=Arthrobacter sp. CDRTa11 TaxID=2651199 RepID=UPI00226592B6|nr:hypothetical protein [Arthrobacter sp. CDRTa11]UZX03767.1 hypothetical protein F8G81_14995 [Arthrobacter sp. CDRTa11]